MLARLSFTLIFLAVMALFNLFAGTFEGRIAAGALSDWGISHRSIRLGELHRLLSATFLSHDFAMLMRQAIFVAVVIGAYEWTQGTRRALIMFMSIDIVGTLLVVFAVLPALVLFHPMIGADAYGQFDVGMSAGGFGLIGALAATLRHRWLCLLAISVAIFFKIAVDFDVIADSAHLLCLFLGFAAQAALIRSRTKPGIAHS